MSNKDKELHPESEIDGTSSVGDCLNTYKGNPKSKVSLAKEDPYDIWEMFQTKYNPSDVDADDDTTGTSEEGQPTIIPIGVRKLIRKNPDYRPGPVKVYTQEEIDAYVQDRSSDES